MPLPRWTAFLAVVVAALTFELLVAVAFFKFAFWLLG